MKNFKNKADEAKAWEGVVYKIKGAEEAQREKENGFRDKVASVIRESTSGQYSSTSIKTHREVIVPGSKK